MRQALCASFGLLVLSAATTSPAQAAPAAPEGRIEVLPFTSLNPSESQPWLGKSIQQSVLADLIVIAPARVISSDIEAKDTGAALDAARKEGARYVVTGSFATAGQNVRVTGQVLDVNTGKPVTAMKVTGSTNNVFSLEDELAAQVRRRLELNPAAAAQTSGPSQEVPDMAPLRVQAQPIDPYVQAYATPPAPSQIENNYYYSNPYNGYGGYGGYLPYYGGWFGGWGGSSFGINVNGVTLGSAVPTGYNHRWRAPGNTIWNGDDFSAGMANSVNGVPLGPLNTVSIGGQGPVTKFGLHTSVNFRDSHTSVRATLGGTRANRPVPAAAARASVTAGTPARH
ncbi:MAG TPA: hypothetical protein VLJ39_16745 [Tepidisphaeraceae bacterium]|nr:hypothetical protein [Tepidisphaeraceae bacterium]